MKKSMFISLIATVVLSVGLFASCSATESELSKDYSYTGETSIEKDGRSFVLEDTPESRAEEAVVMDFLYTITGEFDRKLEVIADIEPHRMSIEAEKRNFEEDVYIKSFVIHNIMTLSEEQYMDQYSTDGSYNPLFFNNLQNLLNEYDLKDYEIVNIDFTWTHSEQALAWGPQWGDGTYNRSFLVGKESTSDNYKIYDYGMM